MKELDLFANELAVMQELHHPLIVQFLGFTISETMGLTLFMEYLPNGSVEDYVTQRDKRITQQVRRKWLDQMTQAIIYLHNRKPEALIHRDLKPANFMLSPSLQCKLGDFGICKMYENKDVTPHPNPPSPRVSAKKSTAASFTSPFKKSAVDANLWGSESALEQTSNVGTARYMAPEVSTHNTAAVSTISKYGAPADIFSLGMVFFFVLEGRPPSIAGGVNPQTHFECLSRGVRPAFLKTDQQTRRLILHCLDATQTFRPTGRELLTLLRAVEISSGMCGKSQPGIVGGALGSRLEYQNEVDDGYYRRLKVEEKSHVVKNTPLNSLNEEEAG